MVGSRLLGYRGSIVAQSPYLEYIPWISYPVPRSHHTIPLEPTTTPSPSGDTFLGCTPDSRRSRGGYGFNELTWKYQQYP